MGCPTLMLVAVTAVEFLMLATARLVFSSSSSLRFRETMFGEGAIDMEDVRADADKDEEDDEDEEEKTKGLDLGCWMVISNDGIVVGVVATCCF